jgi:hypothetical protein
VLRLYEIKILDRIGDPHGSPEIFFQPLEAEATYDQIAEDVFAITRDILTTSTLTLSHISTILCRQPPGKYLGLNSSSSYSNAN